MTGWQLVSLEHQWMFCDNHLQTTLSIGMGTCHGIQDTQIEVHVNFTWGVSNKKFTVIVLWILSNYGTKLKKKFRQYWWISHKHGKPVLNSGRIPEKMFSRSEMPDCVYDFCNPLFINKALPTVLFHFVVSDYYGTFCVRKTSIQLTISRRYRQ
jgi:hypothetical protein